VGAGAIEVDDHRRGRGRFRRARGGDDRAARGAPGPAGCPRSGDGDHGTNMTTGLQAVVRALTDEAPAEAVGPLDVGAPAATDRAHAGRKRRGKPVGPLYGDAVHRGGLSRSTGCTSVDLPPWPTLSTRGGPAGPTRAVRPRRQAILDAWSPRSRRSSPGPRPGLRPTRRSSGLPGRPRRAFRGHESRWSPGAGFALRLGRAIARAPRPGRDILLPVDRSMLDGTGAVGRPRDAASLSEGDQPPGTRREPWRTSGGERSDEAPARRPTRCSPSIS